MNNLILSVISFIYISTAEAAEIKMFCKCFCGSNSTVFELSLNESKPCSLCTKQFCLDNVENGICDGIADATCPSNDFKTACFARDSYKDEMIVYGFLIITFGLIAYAFIKPSIDNWKKGNQLRAEYRTVPDNN